MNLITRKRHSVGDKARQKSQLKARDRSNSLTQCNYSGSAFISDRHQPRDLKKNEQRNVQGKGEEGEERPLEKHQLMLRERL